ncbi:MAG: hypothetical protein A2X49_16780 [Lentisphaerae bacterium GWF2_52_8]|nr:MAG: hypothetical protein A2X49_16780 [Lentisphaerae bacterium GWF2_52_8]
MLRANKACAQALIKNKQNKDNMPSPDETQTESSFRELKLTESVLEALKSLGYETPTHIQLQVIPEMLAGKDIMGQAQTGTGKTAAFALPIISRLQIKNLKPQCIVLTPTRELAIQVAESFRKYASHTKNFQVLPIYGGQPIWLQLKQLTRGVHVVVGTPGRVMDHIRGGSLDLSGISCAVLDEADEMLRMGFIEDVEWILEKTPKSRQTSIFSATLPAPVRRIAEKHMKNPVEISIAKRTSTAETIRQMAVGVSGQGKLEALTRILETEPFDAMLVFVRTKNQTTEIVEKLMARGYDCAALNGDLQQRRRERTIEALKAGKLDIVVATDVAARGLDVERISHVINFDMPYDPEDYVHRIGRTGRAGRSGKAIIFVTPREMRLLHEIEKATRQKVEEYSLPSAESIQNRRISEFKRRILDSLSTLSAHELSLFAKIVAECQAESQADTVRIASAMLKMLQTEKPLIKSHGKKEEKGSFNLDNAPRDTGHRNERFERDGGSKGRRYNKGGGAYKGGGKWPSKYPPKGKRS